MRMLQILGALLIFGGGYVLIKAPTYSSDQSVVKFGDFEAKVRQEHTVPPWVGGMAVGIGAVLLAVGFKKR